jgi:queuine/archaeosine tRNA-ribosyltransferase
MQVEKVMDRQMVAEGLKALINAGVELLQKDKYEAADQTKIKIMRTMGSPLAAAVGMIQAETAQQRLAIVVERMKQIGYDEPKGLMGIGEK